MNILSKSDALHVDKSEGTRVDYYLRDEYEIHYNEQAPHSIQTWHSHEHIWETLFIVEGELTSKWKDDSGKETKQVVKPGDVIETERSVHTFENHTNELTKFLVVKQVLSGENKVQLLKNDKVVEV